MILEIPRVSAPVSRPSRLESSPDPQGWLANPACPDECRRWSKSTGSSSVNGTDRCGMVRSINLSRSEKKWEMSKLLVASLASVVLSVAVFSGSVQAGDLVLKLDTSINGTSPSTTPPWITLDFHTNSPGDVTLSIANNMSTSEFSPSVLFNVTSGINASALTYTYLSGIYTSGITFNTNGGNQIKAGVFSIDFQYPTSNSQPRLSGGTTSVYDITGQGITANSFNAFSTLDSHAFGTYLAAAEVRGIPSPSGTTSGSIGTMTASVPEPSTVTMGLMGILGALAFYRRVGHRLAA
jgi:hypothetical protein